MVVCHAMQAGVFVSIKVNGINLKGSKKHISLT